MPLTPTSPYLGTIHQNQGHQKNPRKKGCQGIYPDIDIDQSRIRKTKSRSIWIEVKKKRIAQGYLVQCVLGQFGTAIQWLVLGVFESV